MLQDKPITEIPPESVTTGGDVSVGSSVAAGQNELMVKLHDLWNMGFTINNTTITFGQIAIALLALIAGVIIAKIVSRHVGKRILPRLKVEPGPASAIQSILYYIMIVLTVLTALQIAKVPLTVFTIFGGALALGIGFGSQNIMNNFISGLILLIERPIQVNDLVTVQDETGTVLKIGARATHIQSYSGLTFIIPNSHLLENSVSNWNLPTRKARASIKVGVAYGSDTGKVKTLLEDLLKEHIRVLDSTDNRVFFMDFGDSSLDFEVHFWISPRTMLDRHQIESDLRFKIDEEFRKNGIEIPFPQRDVHVKSGMS